MITINVQAYCLASGVTYTGPSGETPIDTSYKLYHACGFKSPTMASQIWQGNMVKIGLQTIESLCIGLKCTPAELFKITKPAAPAPVKAAKSRKARAEAKGRPAQTGSIGALKFGQGKKKGGLKTGKKAKR